MTEIRPSYKDKVPETPRLVTHPAQGIGLPLTVGLTLALSLTLLSADRVPPSLFFFALFLMAISVTAFGVYLASFVMLRHAQWLSQRSHSGGELRAGTDA
ncbi:hypothetical protein [Catelliglobosispora koreensis]|uniref:hypothetical protein n=1 Tax=Catelliglobosispora koreensis TaxID=129052 RepID=UPI00037583ED|nr:hypothetical protein [Catelliglobosispora koreensis]